MDVCDFGAFFYIYHWLIIIIVSDRNCQFSQISGMIFEIPLHSFLNVVNSTTGFIQNLPVYLENQCPIFKNSPSGKVISKK